MPSPSRCLTAGDAFQLVRDLAVHPPTGSPRVGLELEWLTFLVADHSQRVELAALTDALAGIDAALPCGSRVTLEPGGQVEVSTPVCSDVEEAIDVMRLDGNVVRTALREHGIETIGIGLDRRRPPRRILDLARYRAMEAYFDSFGNEGRTMMCNTASMQINVDFDGDVRDAWRAAHLVADDLGTAHSERSPNRLDAWRAIDPTRTAPVGGTDPDDAWASYALDARVMFIRTAPEVCTPIRDGTTFIDWIKDGHALGWPTKADLTEHLTTLFPPVRPRGWLEVRTIDALDDDQWPIVARTAVQRLVDGPHRRALLDHACR